jgi:hypothetical protein
MPPLPPAPPLKIFKERLASGRPGQVLLQFNPNTLAGAHHGAVIAYLYRLQGTAFFHALADLAWAASQGHPHARDLAQSALVARPPGPEVPHSLGALQRARVLVMDDLPPEQQAFCDRLVDAFPRLAGTGIPVAPAGFDWRGLLGPEVRTRPVVPSDLRPAEDDAAQAAPAPEYNRGKTGPKPKKKGGGR